MRTATPVRIEVAFSGKRVSFTLNAQFSIPSKGILDRQVAARPRWRAASQASSGRRPAFCVIDGEVWQDETTFRAPPLCSIGCVSRESCLFPHLSGMLNLF